MQISFSDLVEGVLSKNANGRSLEEAVVDTAMHHKLSSGQVRSLVHSLNKVRVWSALKKEASPEVAPVALVSVVDAIKRRAEASKKVAAALDTDASSFITESNDFFVATPDAVEANIKKHSEKCDKIAGNIERKKVAAGLRELQDEAKRLNNDIYMGIKQLQTLARSSIYSDKTAAAVSYAIHEAAPNISEKLVSSVSKFLPPGVKMGAPAIDDDEMINWKEPLPATILDIADKFDRLSAVQGAISESKEKVNA